MSKPIPMRFVPIEPGAFLMGSPNTEENRRENEIQHKVRITSPFEIQMTPVTQMQWALVMGENPSNFKTGVGIENVVINGKTVAMHPNRPVEQVSWKDVQKYITKMNEADPHHTYRLPTEAEWEYSARAGTTTAYSFGDNPAQLSEHAWNSQNSGSQTHDVASLRPNQSGLYDMHGNVWEWTHDRYGNYPAGATVDPTGPATGSFRVLRGGSWDYYPEVLRSAQRGSYSPGIRYSDIGFRLVRTKNALSAFLPVPGARASAGRPGNNSSPITIRRNEKGQLHNLTGPALIYADGFTLYMVDGKWVDGVEFNLNRFLG